MSLSPHLPVRLGVLLGEQPSPLLLHRAVRTADPAYPSLGAVGQAGMAALGLFDPWRREIPGGTGESHLVVLDTPLVLSGTGVVALCDGRVIEDTLDHLGDADGAVRDADGRWRLPTQAPGLPGVWLSLLLGGRGNWFHLMLMNLSRIALLDANEARSIEGILVPVGLSPNGRRLLERCVARFCAAFDRPWPRIIELGDGEAVRPQRLVLPWNVASEVRFHQPSLQFLRGLAPAVPARTLRVYVDRRGAALRPLRDEDAVAERLAGAGFLIARLEEMGFDAQVSLFAEAALVVAPHGAGLSNLAFSAPGTRVIELMPHRLTQWCYRRLCAAHGLFYEGVIGEQAPGPPGVAPFAVLPQQLDWALRLADAGAPR
ncbi:glycosyltransferase family 61 protein [Rhizosaccharibacter radicis]|uniref:Glycosyltransferase family 61 protein n=1 Tax=Rhizosaccharibacter radicis TaxID=2782605 RepID=A0ABT1W0Z2_9PROT|nr:glycosyltransferase family 61 protein [Acetobacteraceae bacterium KSS12]